MKKTRLLALGLSIASIPTVVAPVITLTSCGGQKISVPDITEEGTIVILATGGTIAGSGEEGKETGYTPGSISVESLIASVPGIEDIAPLHAQQVCNINSDDITAKIWVQLAKTINAYADDPEVAGFVVMHGTDTMEETAYFLNLAVKTDKPVVITGSMRPATAISADGPMNLYQSVVVAANPESKGKGVMGVFSDSIYSARSMQKVSTFDVTAISAGPMGALGFVRNKEVFFYEESIKLHTHKSDKFWILPEDKNKKDLPKVAIIYIEADADPTIINWAKESGAKGLVIAGAGAGEFSEKFVKKIKSVVSKNFPVVISSRIDNGVIVQDSVLVEGTVAANDLPPQKAAVLLRLALGLGITKQEDLIPIYKKY
ncbi:MAG: asparaginase [Mycoplasma sp.]|nr:asparaginase [Candidatus Hennigella equi]